MTDLASEWYDDAPDRISATLVHVDSGQTTTIEGDLAVGGSIAGKVTDASSGEPAQACVTAYRVSDGSYARGTGTQPDGTYRIQGLAPTDYNVQFIRTDDEGSCYPPLVEEWWSDRQDQASADVIMVVAESEASGIDAALAPLPG